MIFREIILMMEIEALLDAEELLIALCKSGICPIE